MSHYKSFLHVSQNKPVFISTRFFRKLALWGIRAYQFTLSPLLGPACRFYPSCSEYAYEAILKYGLFRGMGLAVRRILKCHPFHPGGVDLVP